MMNLSWGRYRENALWWASTPRLMWRWCKHDALLYIALGRLRLRVMKS